MPKFFSSMPITAPSASSTSCRPRNSNTLFDLIMKRCASPSGDRRKRMSSLIDIFFCLTKRIGVPSSVAPGEGTLIRYSLAIGLKTCWIRKRSEVSIISRTWLGSWTTLMRAILPEHAQEALGTCRRIGRVAPHASHPRRPPKAAGGTASGGAPQTTRVARSRRPGAARRRVSQPRQERPRRRETRREAGAPCPAAAGCARTQSRAARLARRGVSRRGHHHRDMPVLPPDGGASSSPPSARRSPATSCSETSRPRSRRAAWASAAPRARAASTSASRPPTRATSAGRAPRSSTSRTTTRGTTGATARPTRRGARPARARHTGRPNEIAYQEVGPTRGGGDRLRPVLLVAEPARPARDPRGSCAGRTSGPTSSSSPSTAAPREPTIARPRGPEVFLGEQRANCARSPARSSTPEPTSSPVTAPRPARPRVEPRPADRVQPRQLLRLQELRLSGPVGP